MTVRENHNFYHKNELSDAIMLNETIAKIRKYVLDGLSPSQIPSMLHAEGSMFA